jgi:crotonobetainyl-CoA:carnitine CoA-transferase CaiB-like acyl-CoA transferase
MRLKLPHRYGPVDSVANPIRLSDTPVQYLNGPPLLGEHTDEVLRERLALSEAEIAALRRENVI